MKILDNTKNNYWVYGLLIKNGLSREKIRKTLLENNIETRDFFWPLHKQKVFLKNKKNSTSKLENSEFLGKNGFYIPLGQHLNKSDQEYIAKIIYDIMDGK